VETANFDYELPSSAIAQVPADKRDESRLLFVNRATGQVADHLFRELPDLLTRNTRFFRNTVMVLKARLHARREGGGKVECLLLRPHEESPETRWWCLLRPGKRLPVGASFHDSDCYEAKVLAKKDDGTALVGFALQNHATVSAMSSDRGEMPLPPYIERLPGDPRRSLDEERYQTIYADPSQPFAAAAPTAGLHFTEPVMERLLQNGHRFHDLSLHVGLGTFQPIKTQQIEDHELHEEFYEIPASTRAVLDGNEGDLKLAVGTTSLRAIEDYHLATRKDPAASGEPFRKYAEIYLYPPEFFRTDALLTNFHLPKSSLLCLVSAFLSPGTTDGIGWLKQIYKAALKKNYRFYSYGDAMLIL
jgi:S-adenosylmethionine:tRNA ribosyltransferase-isomerase